MMTPVQSARNTTSPRRIGFTIIEVMIALTASLLMMLALTRAFKMIGDKISMSQSELEMGSTLRNVTFAMRDELDRMTAPAVAPLPRESSSGYFTYYEGPWADGTTQLINNVGPQAGYLPTSRYGDLDDYFAFTARAKVDAPFVGLIPRGILEAHRFEAHLLAGNA
jgi:type II secretory pathway component PulJ